MPKKYAVIGAGRYGREICQRLAAQGAEVYAFDMDEEKVEDIKSDCHYQVGATPEFIEKARNHSEKLKELGLSQEDTPVSPLEPILDAKWRFMWKIGERFEGDKADFP